MRTQTLLAVLLLAVQTAQGLTIIDSILATQCVYYLKSYNWGCNSTSQNAKAYSCRCKNIDWIGSVTSCLESEGALQGKSRAYIDHAYQHIHLRCLQKAHVDWPIDVLKAYQQNATSYLQEARPADIKTQSFHPVSVNQTAFLYYKNSFSHIYDQVMISQNLQWGYVIFWAVVIVLGMVSNFYAHFIVSYWGEERRSKHTSSLFKRLRSTFALPNLFNYSFFRLFSVFPFHIPKTSESVVIALFIIYSVLASSLGFSISLPNVYMNGRSWQLFDLIGYRSGLGAFGVMPMVFFFGLRNNPFIRLTGWSITTFLQYHKWCAWIMAILSMIHSAVWTAYTIKEGDYAAWATDSYWQWGIAGTAIVFLSVFLAFGFIRELAYEVFLVFHQLFGIFFIISMWYHVTIIGWMGWVYAIIAIWAYDRVIRFYGVLSNGGARTAKITKMNDYLIRILVEKPPTALYFPGCYNFYNFLNFKLRFFQSHPFSLMKSKRQGEEGLYAIVFRTHKGITKKVMNEVSKSSRGSILVDVLTEGPYGSPIPMRSHEQFIFISAGVGFTPCYSQAVDLVESNASRGKSVMIKFIWVVQNVAYYNLFKEDMEYLVQNGVLLQVIFTRELAQHQDKAHDLSDDYKGSLEPRFVHLSKRPDMKMFVKSMEIDSSTCFVSSGPSQFIDDVRSSVTELVKTSDIRIDLHEESFSM